MKEPGQFAADVYEFDGPWDAMDADLREAWARVEAAIRANEREACARFSQMPLNPPTTNDRRLR